MLHAHCTQLLTGDGPDADDEAILEDFNAKHFGSRGGTNSIKQPVAAAAAAANGSSGQHQAYHRSKSSILAGDPASYSNHRPTGGAVVPGVAVARIEGCWLSHLNIDNKRWGHTAGRLLFYTIGRECPRAGTRAVCCWGSAAALACVGFVGAVEAEVLCKSCCRQSWLSLGMSL